MTNALSANFLGLLFDILGVVILGRALVFVRGHQLLQQSGTYWNGNNALLNGLIEQRFDARYGLVLLVAGFALQAFGTLNTVFPAVLSYALYGVLILCALAWYPLGRRIIRSEFDALKNRPRPETDAT